MENFISAWDEGVSSHPELMVGFLPFVVHQFVFWTYSSLLMALEVYKFESLYGYKIQKLQVTGKEIQKCLLRVLVNQFFVMLPVGFLSYYILPNRWTPERLLFKNLPSWNVIALNFLVFMIVEEVLFYYSHRLLHYGQFYSQIHKIHHEFKAPIGIAAEYAHPVEMIVANILPLSMGPIICQSHLFIGISWYMIAIIGTISHHSGFMFPWLVGGLDPRFHDYHHYSFIWNFGLLGILDRFHGTDKGFHAYLEKTNKSKNIE